VRAVFNMPPCFLEGVSTFLRRQRRSTGSAPHPYVWYVTFSLQNARHTRYTVQDQQPGVSKLGESSEAQLVGGRTCICAGCLTARYCGRACQRAAWRQHKPVCKALAAAATAAATPTAAAVTGAKGGMAAAGPLSAGAEAADAAEAAVTLCAATAAVGGVSG
jgi:hypothetical protein